MSGQLMNVGASVGYGVPQAEGPTLEEAEAQVTRLLGQLGAATVKYQGAKNAIPGTAPELMAHRADVLANLAGEFATATYVLRRAAYDKATK